jgi:glycosyltransferase involved in cell wall biosynthesis
MFISIITINYNNLEGLIKTTNSVLNQSYPKIEFIVIDGGSTDGSKEYLENKSHSISYWVSESDNGVYHAMNKGLAKASGDYCLFLNSGDYLINKNVLKSVLSFIDSKSDLVYGLIQWESTSETWNPRRDIRDFEMAFDSLIPHQSCFFKTKIIKQLGGYKEGFRVISDWGLMVQMFQKKYKTQKIDLVISICEQQGLSAKLENIVKKERTEFLMKYAFITLLKGYMFKIKCKLIKS